MKLRSVAKRMDDRFWIKSALADLIFFLLTGLAMFLALLVLRIGG